ncbi:PucR family transcriptional regulator ligand-binding domain-containing protein [Clostridium sp. CX1]|uniref:PucR family transcriptional regulator n=1 Tax=Clostridium sp. CX1 TaxID=2978346 RepID=UPI0021C0FA03|nr:PucR family transcriptional regulator [Clostridium sp. CX1]MCT8975197.1 PucR family transcriptional regulator ligand-binding domain-containing protein [Clostridium sp. CX1]
MGVRIDQLMSLPELKDLKLVGGGNGVSKVTRWVHNVETPDIVQYVQNDELIILTGIGVFEDSSSFIKLVKGIIERKASGLIVNVGKYLSKVPEEIRELANEEGFPIFEVPWESNLAEITRIICGDIVKRQIEESSYQDLLKNIIFFNRITYEDFTKRMSAYGYSYFNSFRVITVAIDKLEEYLSFKNIKDEQSIAYIKDNFLRAVNGAIWDPRFQPISFLQKDSVVILQINEKDKFTDLTMLSQIIRESVKHSFADISINIGIGNAYTEFNEIKRSYNEAEKALKVLKAEGGSDETIFYSNIGAYKLLTEIENINLLKEYYDDTVGRLERYDLQNHTDYSKIFHTFLQENGNYIQTSHKLYMHRNTLMYKINKIQEIIKRDLTDTKLRLEFYLGYLVKQINYFGAEDKKY